MITLVAVRFLNLHKCLFVSGILWNIFFTFVLAAYQTRKLMSESDRETQWHDLYCPSQNQKGGQIDIW